MKRIPWLRLRKKTDPELPYEPPIWFGSVSNGEYFHPASKRDRNIRKLVLEKAAENAAHVGMDRRDFLASAMGMATSLWGLNVACSSESKAKGDSSVDLAKFCVPDEAMVDEAMATKVLSGNEFIFDIQTHWFKREDLDKFVVYRNAFPTLFEAATEDAYIQTMFCESQTTMSALTSWPGVACTGNPPAGTEEICGLPLSNESSGASRDKINSLAYSQRVVNHIQIMAQDPNGIEGQLAIMEQIYAAQGAHAWKLYPGFKPPFTMDSANGRTIIEKGLEIGLPVFCVHKGLPIGPFFDTDGGNHPREIGIVARDYPGAKFIIYHSGICTGFERTTDAPPEGPYDPNDPNPVGVNAFIRSLLDNGIEPNSNVYGEVGSALNQVFKDPTVAAHFFGKLMKYVGTDNVCWGTDCIIYGNPDEFIEQFRALEIPQSMQEDFGYPPLDAAQKAKIFGLNAAKAYGIDAEAKRCEISTCPTAVLKQRLDDELGTRRWAFETPAGPKNWDEYVAHSKSCADIGRPG